MRPHLRFGCSSRCLRFPRWSPEKHLFLHFSPPGSLGGSAVTPQANGGFSVRMRVWPSMGEKKKTTGVSQMAYPTENALWPGMSTTRTAPPPRSPPVRYWNSTVASRLDRAPVLRFSSDAAWLALTGCSSDFQKCQAPPSTVQETGENRTGMSPLEEIGIYSHWSQDGVLDGVRFRRSCLISSIHPVYPAAHAQSIKTPIILRQPFPPSYLHPF